MIEQPDSPATAGPPPWHDVLCRVQSEFLEMPGLRLTRAQAARLWTLDAELCDAVLQQLVAQRFLKQTRQAAFVRAFESL
jgi:hypothetical protein